MWQIPSPSEAKRKLLVISLAPLLVMLAVFWSLQTVGSTQAQDPSVDPQVAMTYTVTTAADNGDNIMPTPGSLRQAILDANANPGTDTILFSIPGAGPHTIALLSALPDITEAV